MQFRITDGAKVLMMATVDVDAKQVIHLKLDDEDPIGSVYVALNTLMLHIEVAMARWTVHGPKVTPLHWAQEAIIAAFGIPVEEPIESHPSFEQLVDRFGPPKDWEKRLSLGNENHANAVTKFTIEPQLTTQQMVTAMGLSPCPHKSWLLCEICQEEWADFVRTDDKRRRAWCEACLPEALSEHMKEQASFDRLTEADQPQQGGAL